MLKVFTDSIQRLEINIWKIAKEIVFLCNLRTVYVGSMGFTIVTNDTKIKCFGV